MIENTFICHDLHGRGFPEGRQQVIVPGAHWLFAKLNIVFAEPVERVEGIFVRPSLVGIDAETGSWSNGFTNPADPLHILFCIFPEFHFDDPHTALYIIHCFGGHRFGCIDADGEIGFQNFIASAQQIANRPVGFLAGQVVQCHVESAFDSGIEAVNKCNSCIRSSMRDASLFFQSPAKSFAISKQVACVSPTIIGNAEHSPTP